MSLLFNYYFGSDMYNSGSGSTTLTDRYTTGRTARNATLKKNQGASMTTRGSAISNNYDTNSPYDTGGGLGDNSATHSFKPDPQGNDGGKCSFYEHQLSSSFEDTSFTICTWIKIGSSSTTSDRDTFFASGVRGENDSTTFQLGIYKVSNSIYQLILNINETDNNKYFEITPDNVDYRDNSNWLFVAITYKYDASLGNREIKTYIYSTSTTPDYTNTYTSSTGSGNKNKILSEYDFKFSTYRFGTNRQVQKYWTGSIAASRGYNYVLSSSEITNIYQYNSLNASVAGDPHMKTLSGVFYKYDYLGDFRLLSNNHKDPSKRIVVNGFSEYGESKRWETRQYIRKIYIFCCNKSILINTGFRGIPVSIIENNGIKYTETELSFNEDAEINCFDCRTDFKISEWDTDTMNNHIKKTGHRILKPVRNSITIELTANNISFLVNITNINNYNLQPCRVNIEPLGKISNSFSGTLISRIYSIQSNIPDIKYIDSINKNEKKNNIQLPELEEPQKNINKRYN